MTPLPLELGDVNDPSARRALEQISLRWPDTIPIVRALPASGQLGALLYLTTPPQDGLYIRLVAGWVKT